MKGKDLTFELLHAVKEMTLLACCVPDYTLACRLFEHQGLCYISLKNYQGGVVSFQKMRDAAEESNDHQNEMKAYLLLGRCL